MHTAQDTFTALSGKNVYAVRAVDSIVAEVLRNGEPMDWVVTYIPGEGYLCSGDDGNLDDRYFETTEEIEMAFETWDLRIAHYNKAH